MLSRTVARLSDLASKYSLILLMVALTTAAMFYAVYDLCFAPAYPIADWLINYSAGFVRRGLPGEFILLAARATHIPPPWMAVVVQIPIYVAFLCGVYRLAAPLRRDALWFCIVFSPAALAFMILDPMNGNRKELLLYAALTATIFLLRRNLSAIPLSLSVATLLAILVLSHDALVCCFPYFFAVVAIQKRNLKYASKVIAAPFLVAAFLVNLVRQHPGDQTTAIAVCRSVGGRWIANDDTRNLCAGAIRHLGWTIANSRQEELQNLSYWPLYTLLALLSFAPYVVALVVLYRRDQLRFEVKVITSIAVLCALATAPLFYLTIDWGRWIQMQIVCLLLVILQAAQRAPGFQKTSNAPAFGKGKSWRPVLLVAAFLYCTSWTLPVLGMQQVRFGYVELPLYFHREFRLMRNSHGWQIIDRGW
jgi:hypothetical protein